MSQVNVVVVIVNYRTADMTIDCLGALSAEMAAWPEARAIIVDNGSDDGSATRIQEAIEGHAWTWASVLALEENGGFAKGNNAALRGRMAGPDAPDFVWLLNPDTLVQPDALGALLRFMQAHPEIGLAGSCLLDPDRSSVQRSAFRFPTLASELDDGLRFGPVSRLLSRQRIAPEPPTGDCPTGWVAGASLLVRGAVFEDVGLMDEEYFLYYEEVDFCLAAHRKGWSCWYVPESRVVHLVGQASGITTDPTRERKRRPRYWFESRRRYFVKNHGIFYAALTDMVWIGSHLIWRLRWALQRGRPFDPPHFLGDFIRNSVLVRGR